MQIRILLTVFCISCSTIISAASPRDSTGVENFNGKQLITHRVEAKENYFLLGRRYGVSPKSIMQYNSSIPLHVGTILKIPTERLFEAAGKAQAAVTETKPEQSAPINYKVGPKETLFAISKRFNTTVEEIRQLNNLKGDALSIGQIIKVRQGSMLPSAANEQPQQIKPAPAVVQATGTPPQKAPVSVLEKDSIYVDPETKLKQAANHYGLREQSEHGVAVWIDDENVDGTKMLALHRTAPVGTVIKITNPMTNKSTFAKVVGKFTENETTKDVIIVLTKAVAELVGALDKRFQVNIVYGVPNE